MLRSITAAHPQQMQRALEGLRRYQEAPRRPLPASMPVVAQSHGAALRDYGGTGAAVLFVPSLINPPNVLDLSEERSLLRWLASQGHHVFLLDWGWNIEERTSLSIGGHVTEILLPLIEELGEPTALVGYCLGGTMSLAAAALMPVQGVVTIATPWHFSGFPAEARSMLADLWARSSPTAESLGVLPMEVLQTAFWNLDPLRTVSKFQRFAEMQGSEAADFVTLEDWANDGPPIPAAAARELFESFFGDDLPGSGRWQVGGRAVSPQSLPCPLLSLLSTTDRIVPSGSAVTSGERIELSSGHVGMMVGSRAKEEVWQPLSAWLSRLPAS